jgi:hypothetical protein
VKRILVLLTVAAIFAAAMAISAVSAVADPNCAQVPNNKNCVATTITSTSTTTSTSTNGSALTTTITIEHTIPTTTFDPPHGR